MTNVPIYEIDKVWHIGLMDKSLKQKGSLEGSGLSVSECPLAWEEIAEIGGKYFELTKENGQFLDFHKVTDEQKEEIKQWGIEQGFVTLQTLYKFVFYGEEGEEMYGLTYTYEEAFEEVEDDELVLEAPDMIVPTVKLTERTMSDSLINAFDLLTTVYTEDVLELDGVWFHDNLDRYALSAPRGVIVLNHLDSWLVKEIEEREVPIWGSRYDEE